MLECFLKRRVLIMARPPRFILSGYPQHVIVRGNNRTPIFCAEDDYHFYLEKLQEACNRHACHVHAYVLMTNHVHLLVTPDERISLGKMVQMLGRYYVQYFNHMYHRTGTLWEGRYKASMIDSSIYLLTCMRYIELNPVRAGMVGHPGDYPWSSYAVNAEGKESKLVTLHEVYKGLGKSMAECQKSYKTLFEHHINLEHLGAIRESANKGWVLGSDRFRKHVEEELKKRVSPVKRGGYRRSSVYKEKCRINRV